MGIFHILKTFVPLEKRVIIEDVLRVHTPQNSRFYWGETSGGASTLQIYSPRESIPASNTTAILNLLTSTKLP